MQALAELLRGTQIYLISDEVYEHIIYDGRRHESALRYPELRERAFVIDPALLAVDDVGAVGLLHRAAAHGGGVRAGLRLGQCERADGLALGNGTHVFLLLFLGTVGEDAVAEQRVVDRHDGRMGCVGGGDLHHRQHVRNRVHARATVFGGYFDAHQAVFAEQADVVQRELAGTVMMLRTRGDRS